ncbi:MAG TPA: aldehyde dehydrogenase family protein [Xanthobacteraceae bacterium]|nr:aldehyde dehydrogenase family protein [Xanthobacteraceae bacterium]
MDARTNSKIAAMPPTGLLIGGEWGGASRGRSFATLNPATEDVITEVSEATASDIDAAVTAARQALERGPWPAMTGADRGRILRRLAALMRERMDDLVMLESIDGGKPVAATRRMDIPAAIDCLEYYAGWADKITGETVPVRQNALTYVTRVPVGVVAVIVPWNFALMNAVWKIAPAIACGCTVVLKPAELTPLSALWLGAAALEAGLPPGVLNIVPGYGTDAGAALVSHPKIDKIAFTGSPQTGQFIMRAAAENITKIGLELGGKSPSVVFSDANIESAVRQTTSGAFFNAGQVCSAATRVIVERTIHDEFVEKLAARARSLRMGDPQETNVNLGPVISEKQMQRVLHYIGIGREEGAQIVTGGAREGDRGYFLQPTIFAGVSGDMRIACEEIFGPVVSVLSFVDEEEAVSLANGTDYSLAAAVWTQNIDRGHRMSNRLNAGTVWINTYGPTDTRLPWGGMGGQSGIGRDLGRAALDNYTEQKAIWLQLAG